MGWFVLIVVLIAAAFGVLGFVLKLALVFALAVILALVILGLIAWFWFKSWADHQSGQFQAGGTDERGNTYEARGWVKRVNPPELPGDEDP